MFVNEVIKEILSYYRTIWAINYAINLIEWDRETYMPVDSASTRGVAVGELRVLSRNLLLNERFVSLVEKAESLEDLNDYERGVIRVLKRAIKFAKAFPPEFIREFSKVVEEASIAWREARSKNDYSIFKPYLEKIFELSRRKAEYLGYDEHPYDALIDYFEEGYRTRDIDRILDPIERDLRKLIDKVLSEGVFPQKHPLEEAKYNVDAMRRVNRRILELLGYPFNRGRLDESPHPFTMPVCIRDVRITTRYEGFDFKRTLLSTIHEFGHALYDLQIDERLEYTPLARAVSLGIHESQSRFWENIIARSREFVELIYPILRKNLDVVKGYAPEDIYIYFNVVKPSLIRTEADEVTYNMHIVLRYKLEKQLLTNEIKVDELPEIWNYEMERLLGIRPRSYSEGVLQDIHWSMGLVGYFPTYTIGTLLAAQIRYRMMGEIDVSECISRGDFKPIREYLKEKIHRWGSTYPPKELILRALGEELNPQYFIKYITEKYLKH